MSTCTIRPSSQHTPLSHEAAHLDQIVDKPSSTTANVFSGITPDPSLPQPNIPVSEVDVYIDDCITVAQGNEEKLTRVRDTLMHTIDAVFWLNDLWDDVQAEPISLKKLKEKR